MATPSTRTGMGAIPSTGGVTLRVWAKHARKSPSRGSFNGWSRSAPTFPRVPALLGDELHRMAAIQANKLAGVPHGQPGVLRRVADLHPQVLPGVPCAHGHTPRHRAGCPFMIGDVPLGQARVLFAVPRVETLVRGQMPARQRRMLLDMAVFDSRVLRGVRRTGFRSLHSLVRHDGSFLFSSYYIGP